MTVPAARISRRMGPPRILPASPMLWTPGWLSLKSIRTKDVYSANTPTHSYTQRYGCGLRRKGCFLPRNMIRMTPGTMPTTAVAAGRESMPLDTISAIMRTATRGHDNVLYLMSASSSFPKTSRSDCRRQSFPSKHSRLDWTAQSQD